MPIPLAAFGLVPAAFKTISGLLQKNQAKKLKPSDYISPELRKNQAEANMMVNSGTYTGQQLDEANVRQNTAQAISNANKVAGGANELLNFAGAAQGNENKAMRDIGQRALIWKDQWRNRKMNIQNQIASEQAANRRQYQATKSALIGAGNQNIWGGIMDTGTTFGITSNLNSNNKNLSPSFDFNPTLMNKNKWGGLSKYLSR